MIKEQIEKEVLVTDFEVILPSNEREASPKLQHEIANVFDQTSFQVPLLHVRSEGEEIKIVRVLYQLLGKIRLRGRESFIKSWSARAPGDQTGCFQSGGLGRSDSSPPGPLAECTTLSALHLSRSPES